MITFSGRGLRIPLVLLCAVLLFFSTLLYRGSSYIPKHLPLQVPFLNKSPPRPHHIIDELVKQANKEHEELLARRTHGVKGAAAAYRQRRGRHPPPEFDKWVEYAESQKAIIIESLFDQIYTDLEPYWALSPEYMRTAALSWIDLISVRNGHATFRKEGDVPWVDIWHSMIQKIEHLLPDVDIPINPMDESRLLVPWEKINEYMAAAAKTKYIAHPNSPGSIVTTYPRLNASVLMEDRPLIDCKWLGGVNYWNLARDTCPPNSTARHAEQDTDFSTPAVFPRGFPYGTESAQGYIQNWTMAKDPCLHPHLRNLHGSFVEPLSMKTSQELIPLFGGSKLPMNNEILLPAAMYWSDMEMYSGGNVHVRWEDKIPGIKWRGAASGGRNKDTNWRRFQRHRFVSMTNVTQLIAEQAAHIASAELQQSDDKVPTNTANLAALAATANAVAPHNFPLDSLSIYNLTTPAIALASGDTMDAAFTHLLCFPGLPDNAPTCPYTDPFYSVAPSQAMSEQYHYKYLPDIDGNSFSGRYRGFLRSNSLPIKATIYAEFHDNRLIPWRHFVPMDNTFVDWFGLVDYFLGSGSAPSPVVEGRGGVRTARRSKRVSQKHETGHDDVAHAIAAQGADWAERTLRKEDMLVYVYRLLLEYARIGSEERESMGWVGDLR